MRLAMLFVVAVISIPNAGQAEVKPAAWVDQHLGELVELYRHF